MRGRDGIRRLRAGGAPEVGSSRPSPRQARGGPCDAPQRRSRVRTPSEGCCLRPGARSCDPAPPARKNERFLCTDTPAAQGCPARALHGNRWVDSPMHFYAPCLCTLNRRPLLRRRDHQSLRKDRAQSGALRTGLPLRRERNIASAHARQQRSAPRWSACHQTGI